MAGDSSKLTPASWIVVGLTLLAMVAAVLYIRFDEVEDLLPPYFETTAKIDAPADFSLRFTGLDGRTRTLEDYRGKAIVLNFWATWCPPCVKELPSLAALAEHYKDSSSVVVLCLSDEPPTVLKSFARVGGRHLPVFSFAGENLPAVFSEPGVPRTYLVSPQGRVVFLQMGAADWADASVFAYIDRLSRP